MRYNSKWINLCWSGVCTFIAIIVADATLELLGKLRDDYTLGPIVALIVLTFVTSAFITLAAYNGQRFLVRSQRGRRQ